MTIISKLQFEEALKNQCCADVMHPWHPHCIPATWMMFKDTAIGFNKFMLGLYLLDVLLKWNRLTKEELKLIVQSYLRTGMTGLFMASTFIGAGCILRHFFSYNFYTTVSVPAFLGGLGIFFESKMRTEFILYTWLNMLFEAVFKHLDYRKIWKLNAVNGTPLFMLANGMVMYEIRKQRLRGLKPSFYWFFNPPAVQDHLNNNNNINKNNNLDYNSKEPCYGSPCPHKGSCVEDVRKGALKYLGLGYVFGFAKTAVPNIGLILKKPQLLLKYLLARKTVSFGLFAGLYVALYKISSCILCQSQKEDRDIFALPCGTVAGLAFCVLPGPSILAAILANLIFMYGKKCPLSRSKLPMSELCFAFVNAILFHNYAFYNKLSPTFFSNMLNVATNYRCYQIYKNFLSMVEKLPKQPYSHPHLQCSI